jgi:hypothetical protein
VGAVAPRAALAAGVFWESMGNTRGNVGRRVDAVEIIPA